MTTEVYSCKDGQALKDGKLDYTQDITTREEAEPDAKRRCQIDPTIRKVAYYKVTPDGKFRMFYSYTSSRSKPTAVTGHVKTTVERPVRKTQPRKPPDPGFWGRLARALGFCS